MVSIKLWRAVLRPDLAMITISLLIGCSLSAICENRTRQSLREYINSCQNKQCLDTLLSVSSETFQSESSINLVLALRKSIALNHQEAQALVSKQLALLHYYQGEIDSSFRYKLQSLKLFEGLNNTEEAGQGYADLGYQYKRINLEKAFKYMQKGIKVLQPLPTAIPLANAYNNFGVLHEMKNQYDSALIYYIKGLEIKTSLKDTLGIGYSLENIALIHIHHEQFKLAEQYLLEALKIRTSIHDPHGLLGNYINLGELHLAQGKYTEATYYLQHALTLENEIGHPFAAQYCHEQLVKIYSETNDFKNAFLSLQQAGTIKDSISNEQNIKNVEQLSIQYETEKKEKEIALLAFENHLKDTQITKANQRFFASIVGTIFIGIIVLLLFNRYKHKQKALLAEEKTKNQKLGFKSLIEGEERERKRIAQDLHDGLGQLLSSAKLNVSAMEDQFKETVTTQWNNSIKLIDDAVTEVRTISHNMMPNALISIGFEAALREQMYLINDAGILKVHGIFPEDKIDLPESESIALYRIIQEILNNALKYSKAKNIWIEIKSNGELKINIKDDGVGFDTELIQHSEGIGWQNIRSRTDILNGELNINSEHGKGSEVSLKIAV